METRNAGGVPVTLRRLGRRLYEGWLVIAAHFGEVQTLVIVGRKR